MKIILELTTEELKANSGKTLAEILAVKGAKVATKKGNKKDADDEDEDEEEADEVDADDEDEDAEEEADEVDADMIKEAIGKAVAVGNKAKVAALFAKFKAKTVANLKEANYGKFYDSLKPLTKKK
jgi:ABC-type Zn2+ transport system substrate-binding protein/surface adhesin